MGSNGVATDFKRWIIYLALSCSGHSCKSLFVWICVDLNTLHTNTVCMFYFITYCLSKLNVVFPRIDPKTGIWQIPPVKTTVARRTAKSSHGRVPSLSVWPNPGLVRSPIGHYNFGQTLLFRVKINWMNFRYKHREWQDNPWDHLIEYSRSCGKAVVPNSSQYDVLLLVKSISYKVISHQTPDSIGFCWYHYLCNYAWWNIQR